MAAVPAKLRLLRAETLGLVFEDRGPTGWDAGHSLTARELGLVKPERLVGFPGRKGEHLLFRKSATGRMTAKQFLSLVSSVAKYGIRQWVTLHCDPDGTWIHEGNHRIRAAELAGRLVPVEISYFGNTQVEGWLFPDVLRVKGRQ